MGEVAKTGDIVTLQITGKLGEYSGAGHGGFTIISKDASTGCTFRHMVYYDGPRGKLEAGKEEEYGVKVISVDKNYLPRTVWQDRDGDIIVRTDDGRWMTVLGIIHEHEWPTYPLRRMVPEQGE